MPFSPGKGLQARLKADWLNNGPRSLAADLPPDWRERLVPLYRGQALVLHCLGREDLLKSKLFAYCDRGQDLVDCVALKPTRAELVGALAWVEARDGNPTWPEHVRASFKKLTEKLGYEL